MFLPAPSFIHKLQSLIDNSDLMMVSLFPLLLPCWAFTYFFFCFSSTKIRNENKNMVSIIKVLEIAVCCCYWRLFFSFFFFNDLDIFNCLIWYITLPTISKYFTFVEKMKISASCTIKVLALELAQNGLEWHSQHLNLKRQKKSFET